MVYEDKQFTLVSHWENISEPSVHAGICQGKVRYVGLDCRVNIDVEC